jgi:serine protease Do
MKCPKCGNEQADTETCAACGLIFEKYRRYQEQREQRQVTRPSEPPAEGRSGVPLWAALGVCGTLVAGFLFFRGAHHSGAQPAAPRSTG